MDPNKILTPATGSIGSRFESQASIDEAKENKQKAWKEAYARIGQEPPPEQPEEEYDPRTLYERLQAKKDIKKEEWDSKMKLSNQWRGIDSEEQRFLMEKDQEKKAEQRKLEDKEAEELREYREAQAAKHTQPIEPPTTSSSSSSTSTQPKKIPPKPVRKDVKSLMKGIVVKKKPKTASTSTTTSSSSTPASEVKSIPKATSPIIGTKRDNPSEDPIPQMKISEESDDKRRKL